MNCTKQFREGCQSQKFSLLLRFLCSSERREFVSGLFKKRVLVSLKCVGNGRCFAGDAKIFEIASVFSHLHVF